MPPKLRLRRLPSPLSPDKAAPRSRHRLRQSQALAHRVGRNPNPLRLSPAHRSHPTLHRSQAQGPLRLPPSLARQHQSRALPLESRHRSLARVHRSQVRTQAKAMPRSRASVRTQATPCRVRCLSPADPAVWPITHFPRVAATTAQAHARVAPRASAAATVPAITAVESAAAAMRAALTVRARIRTKARVAAVDVVRRQP